MRSFKILSFLLALALAAFIGFIWWATVVKNHDYFLQHFHLAEQGCWFLAVIVVGAFFLAECRPIWIKHLHDSAEGLYEQASNPGSARQETKNLKTQAKEELKLNRRGFLWARTFAVIMTFIDFVWSVIIFPPFKVPLDKVWDALTYDGMGAVEWGNVGLILGNVLAIPIAFHFLCKELEILQAEAPKKALPKEEPKPEAKKEEPKPDPSSPYNPANPQPYYNGSAHAPTPDVTDVTDVTPKAEKTTPAEKNSKTPASTRN